MSKLKIVEWNIHQQGRHYKDGESKDVEIPLWIMDEIPSDVNIIVLTEFNCHAKNIRQFYNLLKIKGYYFSTTMYSCMWSNDILIAIRGKGIKVKSTSYVKAYSDIPNTTFNLDWNSIPENLRVDVNVQGTDIHLWGIRIKSLEKFKDKYQLRKSEMEMVAHWMKEAGGINVLVGDFNNLRDTTPEQNWNLAVLDGILGDAYKRITPQNNHSWGVSLFESDNSFDGYIKNDHLICPNEISAIAEPYEWSFLKHCNYDLEESRGNKQKLNIPVGEPDHGILIVEVNL